VNRPGTESLEKISDILRHMSQHIAKKTLISPFYNIKNSFAIELVIRYEHKAICHCTVQIKTSILQAKQISENTLLSNLSEMKRCQLDHLKTT
jgi:hypothetical protein